MVMSMKPRSWFRRAKKSEVGEVGTVDSRLAMAHCDHEGVPLLIQDIKVYPTRGYISVRYFDGTDARWDLDTIFGYDAVTSRWDWGLIYAEVSRMSEDLWKCRRSRLPGLGNAINCTSSGRTSSTETVNELRRFNDTRQSAL